MKEKKEVGTLKDLERKFEREAKTAFQRHDAWRLRYLRKRLKTYSLKSHMAEAPGGGRRWERGRKGGGSHLHV